MYFLFRGVQQSWRFTGFGSSRETSGFHACKDDVSGTASLQLDLGAVDAGFTNAQGILPAGPRMAVQEGFHLKSMNRERMVVRQVMSQADFWVERLILKDMFISLWLIYIYYIDIHYDFLILHGWQVDHRFQFSNAWIYTYVMLMSFAMWISDPMFKQTLPACRLIQVS